MCLSTEERQTTDMDWLNSELYALLAIKTSDTAMASIKSLEEVEVKGIIGWHRMEREARVYHRHLVALLTESVTHPERVLKVTDLPQAFYRRESCLKEFQRGRPAELDDDVKANAMRPMLAERKREKKARETGRQDKVVPKERDGPSENGQTLVTRGTLLGTIHSGTGKRTVLRWIRGRLLNCFELFHISVQ